MYILYLELGTNHIVVKKKNQIYPPLMLLWGWSEENPRGLPLDHMDHNWQSRNSPSCLFCPFVHGVLQQPWQEDREMLRTVGTHSLLAWSAATDGVSGLVWWSQKGPLLCIFISKWDFLWQRGRPTNFCKLPFLGFWFCCWPWPWRHFGLPCSPCRGIFRVRRRDLLANHWPFTKIISTLLSPNFWRIRKTDVGPKIPFVCPGAWWNMHPLWVA